MKLRKAPLFCKSSIKLEPVKFKHYYYKYVILGAYLILIPLYGYFFFLKNKNGYINTAVATLFFLFSYIFLYYLKNRWVYFAGSAVLILILAFVAYNPKFSYSLEMGLLLSILTFIPFILIIFSENILHILYHSFLRYRFFTVKGHDFFTQNEDLQHQVNKINKKINVFFIITPITKNIEPTLKEEFCKLIYFWYASANCRTSLRLWLPLFSVLVSIASFFIVLFILERLEFGEYNNFIKMGYVLIFLSILYISMLYHINNFLNPHYYKQRIDKLFKKFGINFRNLEHSNKLLLYLDKNFLVNIYDKKNNRQLNLNSSNSFEKFILKADLDVKGRNIVVNFFITFFVLAFLTIYVTVLAESDTDKFIKDNNFSIHIKEGKCAK